MTLSSSLASAGVLYSDAASVVTSLSPVLVWVVGLIVFDVMAVLAFTLMKGGGSLSVSGGRGGSHGVAAVHSGFYGGLGAGGKRSRRSAARAVSPVGVARGRELYLRMRDGAIGQRRSGITREELIRNQVARDERHGGLVGRARPHSTDLPGTSREHWHSPENGQVWFRSGGKHPKS